MGREVRRYACQRSEAALTVGRSEPSLVNRRSQGGQYGNMGIGRQILKSIQGIWSPKARAEATVGAQVESVIVARRAHPERDMNAWLATALQARIRWGGRPDWWYYTSTAQFSLAGNRAPLAMGLYVLYKEEPALAAAYAEKFSEIMDPISA